MPLWAPGLPPLSPPQNKTIYRGPSNEARPSTLSRRSSRACWDSGRASQAEMPLGETRRHRQRMATDWPRQRVRSGSDRVPDPGPEVAAYPVHEERSHPNQRLARDADGFHLLAGHRRSMHRRQIKPARGLAQPAGIAHVILQPALPDAQRADERGGDDAPLVTVLSGDAGQPERFGADLQDHPGRAPCRQLRTECPGRAARLLQDRPLTVAHAHLTLPSAQVNADVVHGGLLSVPVSTSKRPATSSLLIKPSERMGARFTTSPASVW
jgi:hypothetical protein